MGHIVQKVDHGRNRDRQPLIGALLRAPFFASRAAIIASLHEAGFTDIQAAHLAVFQHPGPDGRRPRDVARSALTSKQAMNNLLSQLERANYLTRTESTTNRRERTIALTTRGHAVIAAIRNAVSTIEKEWQAALGTENYRQLQTLLQQLNHLIPHRDDPVQKRV